MTPSESAGDATRAVHVIRDGVVVVTLGGAVTSRDFIAAREAFLRDPAFVRGMPCLYDLRDTTVERLDEGELQQLRFHGLAVAERRGDHRTALVATTDAVYGVSRMYEVWGERPDLTLRTFRSFDDAVVWLLSEPESDQGGAQLGTGRRNLLDH